MENYYNESKKYIKILLKNKICDLIDDVDLLEAEDRLDLSNEDSKCKESKFWEYFEQTTKLNKYQILANKSTNLGCLWIEKFLSRNFEKFKLLFNCFYNLNDLEIKENMYECNIDPNFFEKSKNYKIIDESLCRELTAEYISNDKEAIKKFMRQIYFSSPDYLADVLWLLYEENEDNFKDKFKEIYNDIFKTGELHSKLDRDNFKAYFFGLAIASINCHNNNHASDEIQYDDGNFSMGASSVNDDSSSFYSGSLKDDVESISLGDNSDDDKHNNNEDYEEDSDDTIDFGNIDFTEIFGNLKNCPAEELLSFNSSSITNKNVTQTEKLQMRNYQNELAIKGIDGENVLICAPTGSGKTVVAVKIVDEHLKRNKNGKVAFLVHKIALVEQQYKQFSRYLNYKITQMSGTSKNSGIPLLGQLDQFQIFILTSDILKNALETKEIETKLPKSISEFSMILFDECHNCDKKHPYNRIMTHYFEVKKQKKWKVPQIIGFTASTGTDKACTMDKAMKHLYRLCANLDCYIVSTVKTNVEELTKNQSVPNQEIITSTIREEDHFDELLQNLMRNCERIITELKKRAYFPSGRQYQSIFSIPEDRLHHKYNNFVSKLNVDLINHTKSEHFGRQTIAIVSEYLNYYVRALMVNHLFNAKDAYDLLVKNICMFNVPTCPIEVILRKEFKKIPSEVHLLQTPNPCLEELITQIKKQMEQIDSRIIVFVRERIYTTILVEIFKNRLPHVPCECIVGNTISAVEGGLTQNEMERVLERFRSGATKVLFSTTVAEEGLDVQQCNLVIRYGHVTNETAMVQSRGRARAQESKYIVIVPAKLVWQVKKENINIYRESMMYLAIENFQKLNETNRNEQIELYQQERQIMESEDQQQRSVKKTTAFKWNMHCRKCTTFICSTEDIRLVADAHFVLINKNQFNTLILDNNCVTNVKPILCAKCLLMVGNRLIYRMKLFPSLKITELSLSKQGHDEWKMFKKWKDVPFDVKPIGNRELLEYSNNHSLSDI